MLVYVLSIQKTKVVVDGAYSIVATNEDIFIGNTSNADVFLELDGDQYGRKSIGRTWNRKSF